MRNAGGDKNRARTMVLKALGVKSLNQLSAGLRMTAIAALEGKL